MNGKTTVQLDSDIVNKLKEAKEYPEQTYNNLIEKMIDVFEESTVSPKVVD